MEEMAQDIAAWIMDFVVLVLIVTFLIVTIFTATFVMIQMVDAVVDCAPRIIEKVVAK